MVKRVDLLVEHLLIQDQTSLIKQFTTKTLNELSIAKLIDSKIATKNLKTGLDFMDAYKARNSRGKLLSYVISEAVKQKPSMADPTLYKESLMTRHGNEDTLSLNLIYDLSISRFVNRVQRKLSSRGIPVSMVCYPAQIEDKMTIVISPSSTTRSTLHYYKLMFLLPECVKFLMALSKKATFVNEQAITRSRRSGHISARSTQSSNRRTGATSATVGAAQNARRAG